MNNTNNSAEMQKLIEESILAARRKAEAARKAAAEKANKLRIRILVKEAINSTNTTSNMSNKSMQNAIAKSIANEIKRKNAANNNATQKLLEQFRKNNAQVSSNSEFARELQMLNSIYKTRTPSPKLTQKKRPSTLKEQRPSTPPKEQRPSTLKEQRPSTPPKEQRPSTSQKEQRPSTPTKAKRPSTPPKEQRPSTSQKEQRPSTPPKAKRPATPPKAKRPATPATPLTFFGGLSRSSKVAQLLIAPINQYRITDNDKKNNINIPYYILGLLSNEEHRIQILKSTTQITFCEAQESAGCGRHAINNLLGGVFFVKHGGCIINNDNYTQRNFTIPINMPSLCAFLVKSYPLLFSGKRLYSNCPDSENYLYSVIIIALNMLGYMVNEEVINGELYRNDRTIVKINDNKNADNFIGFIANINKGHWICYRKLTAGNYLELNSIQCSRNLYNEVSFDYITERAPIPISKSHIGSARGIYQIYKVIFIGLGLDYRDQDYSMLEI